MGSIQQYFTDVRDLVKRPRNLAAQVLGLAWTAFSVLMLWKGLMVVTMCENPVVVVVSNTMAPTFHRGDFLFLTNYDEDRIGVGDIVCAQVTGSTGPVINRVKSAHENSTGFELILTKGDANEEDDRHGIYQDTQLFLTREMVVGRAWAFVPYLGMIKIWLTDYPSFRIFLIGSLGFFVIIGRE